MSKIMQVFYGTDLLPYKDQARSVHYPIVGNAFLGASNTTEIRFYIDQIGNYEDTWVANSKLPNGKMGNEILTSGFDSELNEHYVKMTLSTFYTQAIGNLFISLNGFVGGVQIVEQDGIYTIQGTPTIQATGSVKIAINYATPLANGDELSQITLQQILSEISTKLPKNSQMYIKVVWLIDLINTSPYGEYLKTNDIVFASSTKRFYQLSGTFPTFTANEIALNLNNLTIRGNLTVSNFASITNGSQTLENYVETKVGKTNTANRVYGTDNSGNQTTIPYSASGTAASGTIVSRATGGHILIPYIPTQENAASSKSYTDSFGKSLEVSIDSSTYVMTLVLKAGNGNTLSTQTVDLPLETMVVGGSYDDTTEELVLLLNNGNTIRIPVSDLVSGLVSETDLQTALSNYFTKSEINEELSNKANVDGNYPTMTVGLADNLTPYSEDSGSEQDNPFISNGTGTNNNQEIVTVGDYGLLRSKNGNSIIVSLQVPTLQNTKTVSGITFTNNGDGTMTISGTATAAISEEIITSVVELLRNGNNILISLNTKLPTGVTFGVGGYLTNYSGNYIFDHSASSIWTNYLKMNIANGTTISNLRIKPFLCDLTLMFNGNIPQDLLDNPSHFSWYYNGDLSYNTGTLVNANGVKLVSTGRNLWDEEVVNIRIETEGTNNSYITSKNYISVVPNTIYYLYSGTSTAFIVKFYDKDNTLLGTKYVLVNQGYNTFETPSNCEKIRFGTALSDYGGTYNNDITISLYYTPEQGGEGYNQYYPYETPYEVNTGSEVLRSAGSVYDYKEPNGTIHRRIGSYTFTGNEVVENTTNNRFYVNMKSLTDSKIKPATNDNEKQNVCIVGLLTVAKNSVTSNEYQVALEVSQNNALFIYMNSSTTVDRVKTFLTGKTLYYELAEYETEQGTSFSENLPINDYGMFYWLDSSNNLVGVPQGNSIFFPINYKGFVDDMYSRVDGDSSKYVIDTQLSASETQRDTIDTQLKNAIGGTLRQLLASSQSLDFANTDFLDLGDLNWTYRSADNVFSLVGGSTISTLKTNGKVLSTLYKTNITYADELNNMEVSTTNSYNSHDIVIKSTSYTNATDFKNAMKGVLLAYEKA